MTSTVNRYRYYCNTESLYVYKWDTSPPTVCVNNPVHSINLTSISISDQVTNSGVSSGTTSLGNLSLDQFGVLRTISRQTPIDLKSIFGVTQIRDTLALAGTGTVTNTIGDSEYKMFIQGVTDVADLRSAERGRYISGMSIEAGIGIRIPTTLGTNQRLLWGLYDGTNGIYFKYVASQLSVNILRDGVETSIPQSAFNVDSLDGNGPSGIVYSPSSGITHRITFSWYGYDLIDFSIIGLSADNKQNSYSVHRIKVTSSTSVKNPNLPLCVRLEGNGNNLAQTVYVAARQYSIIGEYKPIYRLNSHLVVAATVSSSTIWQPIISIRKKVTHKYINVLISSLLLVQASDVLVQIRIGNTLVGASWVTPVDQTASETAVECDTSAISSTGGVILHLGYGGSGVGTKTGNSTSSSSSILGDDSGVSLILTETNNITVFVKYVTTPGTATAILRWKEEF